MAVLAIGPKFGGGIEAVIAGVKGIMISRNAYIAHLALLHHV